ncbi:MAG: cell division protein FtsN [Gammaproteobacteria bacterium]|jgi:cell division protein FtsN
MVGLFASGILYLDRQIVKTSEANAKKPETSTGKQKPKIDFYTVLEERVMDIPVSKDDVDGLKNPSINKQAIKKFTLQAGSFKSAFDADSLKAQLAFIGLEAKVHSANVNGSTWHRVVLGPFASNTKISRAKNLLLENGIKYVQRSVVQ